MCNAQFRHISHLNFCRFVLFLLFFNECRPFYFIGILQFYKLLAVSLSAWKSFHFVLPSVQSNSSKYFCIIRIENIYYCSINLVKVFNSINDRFKTNRSHILVIKFGSFVKQFHWFFLFLFDWKMICDLHSLEF